MMVSVSYLLQFPIKLRDGDLLTAVVCIPIDNHFLLLVLEWSVVRKLLFVSFAEAETRAVLARDRWKDAVRTGTTANR